MRKKLAKRKNDMSIPAKNVFGVFISNFIALIIIIILTLLCSLFLLKSQVMPGTLGGYFIGCIGIGALINGFISSKQCTLKGILSGLISSVPFALLITFIMLFFTKGQLEPTASAVYITVIICSTVGGILGANTRRRR